MQVPESARLVRVPLEGTASAAEGALIVRGDAHPFALAGDWAGGGALVGSEPIVVAGPDEDPFAVLDRQPVVETEPDGGQTARAGRAAGEPGAGEAAPAEPVGGGWFGYLGYNL